MSSKNKAQMIKIAPLTPKEQVEFFRRCDKLYLSMLQNNSLKQKEIQKFPF